MPAAWYRRREIDLAEAVAADVALRLHQPAEPAGLDLRLDPAEMVLAAALIAEREDDAGRLAEAGDFAALGDGVGDRLVEKHVLAGGRRHPRGLEMDAIGRRVDDRRDRGIGQNFLVARRGTAAVFRGKGRALLVGSGEAGGDLDRAGALRGIRQHVGPPADAEHGDAQRRRRGIARLGRPRIRGCRRDIHAPSASSAIVFR